MPVQKPIYIDAKLWNELSENEQKKLNAACVQLVKIRILRRQTTLFPFISTHWQYLLLTGDAAEIIAFLSSASGLQDNLGTNPYHYLLIRGDQALLESINERTNLRQYSVHNNFGITIAHYAALSGSPETLNNVLAAYPELKKAKTHTGATIAHYAAWSGSSEALNNVLARYPALQEVKDNDGCTIAHFAAWSGSPEALNNVLARSPVLEKIKDNIGGTIAHFAAWSGSPEALNNILARYPALQEVKNNVGHTIAHFAALSGSPEILKYVLARYPALQEVKDNVGSTIAHFAAWSGSPEALNNVLAAYPELKKAKNNAGGTIAHFAALSGSPEALNNVLATYPELQEVKDNDGGTIAHFAALSGSPVILTHLLEQKPVLMSKLWISDKNGNTLDSYSTQSETALSATQVLNQCLLASCQRILQHTHNTNDIDLLNAFQEQFLDLIVFDDRNNLSLEFYSKLLDTSGLKLCSNDKIAALLRLKAISTKGEVLDVTLIDRIMSAVGSAFRLASNRQNLFFNPFSTSSFNLVAELNHLHQALLQRQQIANSFTETHNLITTVQVLIDDAQRFPIPPEFKQVTRLIVEKLSMTKEIMAKQPKPVDQTSVNTSHDNTKERYEAIQIDAIKTDLSAYYHSEVDAVMAAFHALIFNREAIKRHFAEQYGVLYFLHEKIPLHTDVVVAGDVTAFDATLGRLVKEFLNGFDIAKKAGVTTEYFRRLTLGYCIEGRTRDAFTWIASYSEVKSIDVLMEKFYNEYQAYYTTLYSDINLYDLSLVINFIIERYAGFPCLPHQEFAPNGIICKEGVRKYCQNTLAIESLGRNCACVVM